MAAIEETIPVTIEQGVVSAPETDVSPATEETSVDVGKVAKKSKEAKPKKVSVKKVRSPPAHPPYFEAEIQMITEALTTLKERNGSSQHALQKFIEENHKNLPPNFRKLLLGNLRKLVASGKLVKVKNSFKLPSASKPAVVKAKPTVAKPKKAAVKPKKAVPAAVKPKKAVAAAVKPKSGRTRTVAAAAAVTAKAKVKATKPASKAKVTAAVAKPKVAGTKRKAAVVVVKPTEKAAKVAKTATRSTPSKKAAPVAKVAKSAAPKSVKPKSVKSVKSPAKRAMPRRGRK